MLGNLSYDWRLLTKYVSVFGAIFSNIFIKRYDINGNTIGDVKVPIEYARKEKMLMRAIGDPDIQRQFSALLPRLSFVLETMDYDGSRKLPSTAKYSVLDPNNANAVYFQFNPVPYNLKMKLWVYAQNPMDANQIMEQIVPFFTPDWTPNIELIPSMDQVFKTPIVLDSTNNMDLFDGDFKDRQILVWELNFTIKAYLFGPQRTSPIIKFGLINVLIGDPTSNISNAVANVYQTNATPGLLVNGSPTTNSALSIPVSEIFANSDFGYCLNTVDFIG